MSWEQVHIVETDLCTVVLSKPISISEFLVYSAQGNKLKLKVVIWIYTQTAYTRELTYQ